MAAGVKTEGGGSRPVASHRNRYLWSNVNGGGGGLCGDICGGEGTEGGMDGADVVGGLSPPVQGLVLPGAPPTPLCTAVAAAKAETAVASVCTSPSNATRPSPSAHVVHLPSLATDYAVVLISEAARGLLLPALYPHLLAAGGQPATLGVLVAAFSIGRLAATVPLGWASDAASMRTVLAAACVVQAVGHLAYGAAVGTGSPVALLAARMVVGAGSATMSVTRAHVARAVGGGGDLTAHLGWLSGAQFAGFAVLPGVGGVLASLPGGGVGGVWWLVGALFAANGAAVLALAAVYQDPPGGNGGRGRPPQPTRVPAEGGAPLLSAREEAGAVPDVVEGGALETAGGAYGATGAPRPPPPPDGMVVSALLLLNVALRGIMAALETVATPFLVATYAPLSIASAAGLLSLLGIAGLGVFVSFKPLARAASDAQLVAAGLACAAAGAVPLLLGTALPGGGGLPLPATVTALGLLWSAAYPLGQTAVLSAFAKATAGTSPGAALGLFSASGSGARVGGALVAGLAWAWGGAGAVWGAVAVAAVAGGGGLARVYNRL